MDIFEKIKPEEQKQEQPQEQKIGGIYVKIDDTYYCSKPQEIKYFSEGQVNFVPQAKSTFRSRQKAKSFYRKSVLYLDSMLSDCMQKEIAANSDFDFSCLSIEKQRKLLIMASQSIDVAEFLHKKGFDFDDVIKKSTFVGDLNEIVLYQNVIVYLKDKNVCDANGIPLLLAVSNAEDFMHVLRYKADTNFVVNNKTLKDYIIQRNIAEIVEVAFACGVIGVTRSELMGLSGINDPRRRYCPFLDMLKTEVLETEKRDEEQSLKVTTKKELSAKAEIDALFENAQTSIK